MNGVGRNLGHYQVKVIDWGKMEVDAKGTEVSWEGDLCGLEFRDTELGLYTLWNELLKIFQYECDRISYALRILWLQFKT